MAAVARGIHTTDNARENNFFLSIKRHPRYQSRVLSASVFRFSRPIRVATRTFSRREREREKKKKNKQQQTATEPLLRAFRVGVSIDRTTAAATVNKSLRGDVLPARHFRPHHARSTGVQPAVAAGLYLRAYAFQTADRGRRERARTRVNVPRPDSALPPVRQKPYEQRIRSRSGVLCVTLRWTRLFTRSSQADEQVFL